MFSYKALFNDLTTKQQETLGLIAINQDHGLNTSVVASLERRGLIATRLEQLPGWPAVTVKRYHLPISIHIAWCEWCSENLAANDTGD